jgi:long-chain acyl-CoA synthetase
MNEVHRVFDILDRLKIQFPKPDIIACKINKQWKTYSCEEFYKISHYVSAALLHNGILPGEKVIIMSNNRPEWNFTDFGSQMAQVVSVPVFPTISSHDLAFIVEHSEAKAAFVSSQDQLKKIQESQKEKKLLLISFTKCEGAIYFENFIQQGREQFENYKSKINDLKAAVKPDDLLTILYTSGTTGTPKGVMLSHNNLVQDIIYSQCLAPFAPHWKALSFLPLNHVFERMVSSLYFYVGCSVYYAEGFETISENLKEVKPQIFVTVPRLLERVYDKIVDKGEKLSGLKKKIFFWALDIAQKYELNGANGFMYELKRRVADKLVFSKWREALGGNIVCVASGGAALQPRLARIFTGAGIIILEGYGLTETSPVVAVNNFNPDCIRFGTVGTVIENIEVKIAEDGEILVRGPIVMKGYYKNEEETKKAINEEGWFHTGDIGTFVENRFLKITDRKKEIFKTSAGKYIAPLVIENKIKECRFVEQCMVIGEGQKFASALIVPNVEYMKEWCAQKKIEFTQLEHMVQHPEIIKEVNNFIRRMNKDLAPYEQIKRQVLLHKNWSIESGELTPKLSMKRKVIMEKNKEVITKIFSVDNEH